MMAECIVCGIKMTIPEDTEVNEIILCEECETELEVVGLNPIELQMAPEIEEDWGE